MESLTAIRDAVDTIQHVTRLMRRHRRKSLASGCDAVTEPDLTLFPWTDFDRYEERIQAGEQATRDRLPDIQRRL